MNCITAAQLLRATAHETPFGPVVAHQVQPRVKRAADGVTEAVLALGRAGVAHGAGQSPSEEARIARVCRLVGVLQLAGGARSRGRRVPIEGVLLFGCASCAVAPRRRGPEAAVSCGRDNPTNETDGKEARRPARREDQRNTPTSSTSGGRQGDTSYPSYAGAQRRRMSTKVHGTTCAQARELGLAR